MSSPGEWYNSLPPITRAYGTICLAVTSAFSLGFPPYYLALLYPHVFKYLQVIVRKLSNSLTYEIWRLVTNYFVLGVFSFNFGIRLLMIARYGVELERGPFARRTGDFLWMMLCGGFFLLVLSAIPWFTSPFLGVSLVFMLLYVWSREFPTARVNIYGLFSLKAFYLPWAMLVLDLIFGQSPFPDLLGILAGHLYYFLTVIHPLAGGKNILATPRWINRFVARWRIGVPPAVSAVRAQPRENTSTVFRGRAYRLSD